MPSLYLRLLRQWLNNSFLLSSLRRHQIQQEVVAGTSHPPKPPTASPHLHSNSNNTLNTSPYTSLKTLKTQILALETREAELRKSLQHSANAKRALTEVIDELRGRVGKLEGSSVVEELQRRVEKLQDQNGVVEALEKRVERLETQGGRRKMSGWLTFALFSTSALFCVDIAMRLAETPQPGKKKKGLDEGKGDREGWRVLWGWF